MISLPLFSFITKKNEKESCYTSQDVEGPFFKLGAPIKTDLAEGYDGGGIKLMINGIVFGNDCQTPQENCQIEIWHASPKGSYDL